MILVAWILSMACAFYLGYRFYTTEKQLNALKIIFEKPKKPEEKRSYIIDPDDPVQQAERERKELFKKLNPEDDNGL